MLQLNDDFKYLHDSLFDWCVIVIADKKTPDKWSYKNINLIIKFGENAPPLLLKRIAR